MDIACVFGRGDDAATGGRESPHFSAALLARFAVAALRSRCGEAPPVAHLSSPINIAVAVGISHPYRSLKRCGN